MKQLLNISLSLLLLTTTVGVTVSKHYCGGFLVEKSIILHADSCGDTDQMPDGCCRDEFDNFTIEDDFELAKFVFDQQLIPLNNFILADLLQMPVLLDGTIDLSELTESPPPPPIEDIYIQIESFLI